MKKKATVKAILISLFIISSYSFSATNFVTNSPDGVTLDVLKLITFITEIVSQGMNTMIQALMPIFGSIVAIDYSIGVYQNIKGTPKDLIVMSIHRFLKYGCLYYLATNWFSGTGLANSFVTMMTGPLAQKLMGTPQDENNMIATIIAVVVGNLNYMYEAPMQMLQSFEIGKFIAFMIFLIFYATAMVIIMIASLIIIGELLTETVNIIIMTGFSVVYFILGLVKGFENRLFFPLKIMVSAFIKYLVVYWLYSMLWSVIKGFVLWIKIPPGYKEFDIQLIFKAMVVAAIMAFAVIIFKLVTMSIMNTLNTMSQD